MTTASRTVPFFRPAIGEAEIREVVETLRSGWVTTGPRVRQFEADFAAAVGSRHAVAVNSCTAALHLALEALGLQRGEGVLVPTMTFAATAEVVRYLGGLPILVDCDPVTLNMDLRDAESKLRAAEDGRLPQAPEAVRVRGVLPVHVGGLMLDMDALHELAGAHGLWVVEDAAHAFPARWRRKASQPWTPPGRPPTRVACFSFYANKTITTGEGGMAVTDDTELADRMRIMSLHGLSKDAWDRYAGEGGWDYRIVAPGFKYNLTDVAAAIGIHQLARAEELRREREGVARFYLESFAGLPEIETPPCPEDRLHAWHLFPIRLKLERLAIDRDRFIEELKAAGVGCSVHWRPLHLHPYYRETLGWTAEQLPVATRVWERLVSLPIFPGMIAEERDHVVTIVRALCERFRIGSRNSVATSEPTGIKPGLPRAVDATVALLGLCVAAPLLLLSAAAVRLGSKGPVLFRQERLGRDGRCFGLLKLRTMRLGATGPALTARGDSRITPVGRALRKLKLDELPQLWNVLRGEMSLVGPRPEVPRYVDLGDPVWRDVLRARPGLTDPVTLRLRDEEALLGTVAGDPEEYYLKHLQPFKLRGYLAYLHERDWRADLVVLTRTVLAAFIPALAPPPSREEIERGAADPALR